ncbi:haloacid dehalogenase [Tetragenococcus halophilus subsp. flandriensis]|uniref:Cof-type HAD-IIB family hydrolase n=1 Tax=Tetragenococcus halophilus TaxID=51669 RepID=UPI0023E95C04|nr:Cof-type HAD-IIB family hydrolase [Tetragenococcus halophilus]GMA08404.1 haloacid dehalogenase [Tetragenococcus halophilus subsp. flandriensis]
MGLFFFDLDGTLLNKQSQISQGNLKLLKQLEEQGYLSVVVSGRSPIEIEEITQETTINSYVSMNGQYVVLENEVFANHQIDNFLIAELLGFAERLGHPVSCYTPTEYRINFIDEATKKLYTLDNAPLPKIDPYFYKTVGVNMLYLFSENTAHDHILQERFNETLTFYRDSPFSLAIVNKNRSKKAGIKELLENLKITDKANTYAFGDGNNDISMFEVVNHSVAMGNADENVKQAADLVTLNHEKEGIEFALRKLQVL